MIMIRCLFTNSIWTVYKIKFPSLALISKSFCCCYQIPLSLCLEAQLLFTKLSVFLFICMFYDLCSNLTLSQIFFLYESYHLLNQPGKKLQLSLPFLFLHFKYLSFINFFLPLYFLYHSFPCCISLMQVFIHLHMDLNNKY
jgi:hypothetical protein